MYKNIFQTLIFSICFLTILGQPQKSQSTKNSSSSSKAAKQAAPVDKGWYIAYRLEIKGDIALKDYPIPGDETKWSVNRTYTARIDLNKPLPYLNPKLNLPKDPNKLKAFFENGDIQWIHEILAKGQSPNLDKLPKSGEAIGEQFLLPVHVLVKDICTTVTHEKGEGGSFEDRTEIKAWAADCEERLMNTLELIFYKTGDYEIDLPVRPMCFNGKTNMTLTTTTIYKRSSFGYGKLPTDQRIEKEKKVPVCELRIPQVSMLLDGLSIHHSRELSVDKVKDGDYEYDSGELELNAPLIKELPVEAQNNIRAHIYYRFAKNE